MLRISNTYCFSTATIVTRTRLSVTFIRTLPVLLTSAFDARERSAGGKGKFFPSRKPAATDWVGDCVGDMLW
jgi:hypothetical protein